jgi:hypothetical protein
VGLAAALLAAAPLAGAEWTTSAPAPTVVFDTPGVRQVTLEVCNQDACATITRAVEVLDPAPRVDGMAVEPGTVEVGDLVSLAGTGLGRPPVTLRWRVALAGAVVGEIAGDRVWWDSTGALPGVYSVTLLVRNGVGEEIASAPVPLLVVAARGAGFYTLPPCRLLDTRQQAAPLSDLQSRVVAVAGLCGVPADARAIAANVTAVEATGLGHLVLYPGNYPEPDTSSINFRPGQARANNAVLKLANDGSGALAARAYVDGAGQVDFIVDVSGYFLSLPQ